MARKNFTFMMENDLSLFEGKAPVAYANLFLQFVPCKLQMLATALFSIATY